MHTRDSGTFGHRICPRRPPVLALVALLALGGGCTRTTAVPVAGAEVSRTAVTALGRVTPGRAVISIAAQPGSRVLKLEVGQGDTVSAGQVLATLDTFPVRVAERDAATAALEEARERLRVETAYGEALVEQNRQAVRLLELARERERRELQRTTALASSRAAAAKEVDDQAFLVATREAELDKANAELRTAEAALARARSLVGVTTAEARVKAAAAQLEMTVIRAPLDGAVLRIFTYPGERIGNDPILQVGDTRDMYVVAEVRETDLSAVRVGQRATVTSPALRAPLDGTVDEIGLLIFKNDVLDPDPRADKDGRVVEVRVKLDTPEAVARLTRLEVSTRIDVGAGAPAPPATR